MRHSTGNKLETSTYKYSKIFAILLDLIKNQDNMKLELPGKIENLTLMLKLTFFSQCSLLIPLKTSENLWYTFEIIQS